jgi:hypothetical protein
MKVNTLHYQWIDIHIYLYDTCIVKLKLHNDVTSSFLSCRTDFMVSLLFIESIFFSIFSGVFSGMRRELFLYLWDLFQGWEGELFLRFVTISAFLPDLRVNLRSWSNKCFTRILSYFSKHRTAINGNIKTYPALVIRNIMMDTNKLIRSLSDKSD